MVEAHIRDGAALAHFYAWLRRTVVDEGAASLPAIFSAIFRVAPRRLSHVPPATFARHPGEFISQGGR